MAYRPEQRAVPSRILTSAGWMTGTFHFPLRSRMADQLNRGVEFFRLTDVTLHGHERTVKFLSVQRDAMLLVLPPATETDLHYVPEVEPHVVHPLTCLLELGTLEGKLEVLRNVRVSDYFLKRQGFVVLEDCTIRLGGFRMKTPVEEKVARALVNSQRVLAVSDVSEPPPPTDTNP